jgi:mannose-6-phosphate isomerase-like protein (cupin superfamily)
MRKASRLEPLRHYPWGHGCTGWELADEEQLSVKEEYMPPGTAERLHVHQHATQVFYILTGEAVFEIEGQKIIAAPGESITIHPGEKHRICNDGPAELIFILSSAPSTRNDRTDIDEHE